MTNSPHPNHDSSKFSWVGSSVFVNQGRHWSSAFIWLSSTLFGSTLIFAFTAKIDQTVSVRGTLQPLAVSLRLNSIIWNCFRCVC